MNDVINKLLTIGDELKIQKQILEIKETIAMISNNKNIVELRNELFATVKLIYSDKINDTLKEMNKNSGIIFKSIAGLNTSFNNTATDGISNSLPMQVDGKSTPNCEDVKEIINVTLNKHSIWNKVKEIFSREKN